MASVAKVLGIIGGIIGALIGGLFLVVLLFFGIPQYNAGYYLVGQGGRLILPILASFGILAFSVLGALGGAQKLDARPTVNAGALFLAGVVVLFCTLYLFIPWGAAIFVFVGLFISVSFFLSGYLLFRIPAS